MLPPGPLSREKGLSQEIANMEERKKGYYYGIIQA